MDPMKTDSAGSESHDEIDVRIEKLKVEANALTNGQMRRMTSNDLAERIAELSRDDITSGVRSSSDVGPELRDDLGAHQVRAR